MLTFSQSWSCLSAVAEPASFASLIKILLFAVPTLLWLFLAPKMNKDALSVRSHKRTFWCGLYLLGGFAGVLAMLLIPSIFIGLPIFILLIGGIAMGYLSHRNSLVDEKYRVGIGAFGSLFSKSKKSAVPVLDNKVKIYEYTGGPVLITEENTSDLAYVEGYNTAQDFLFNIALFRAGEVLLAANDKATKIRFMIDGVAKDQPAIEPTAAKHMIKFIKKIAGIDSAQKQTKGKISIDLANSPMEMQITAIENPKGAQLKIRVMNELIQTKLDASGMQPDQMQKLNAMLNEPGIVIVSGPAGIGRTSTAYSLTGKQDAFMRLLVTLEKQPEAELDNITQNAYESDDKLLEMLTSTIRRDPDFIYIDKCPDTETAKVLCDFAREKTVILDLPADDTFAALAKWIKLVGNIADAVAPLNAITNQMLIRKLCGACKESYTPAPAMLQKLRLKPEQATSFMRPIKTKPRDKENNVIPCQACKDIEYQGRIGVFEILEVNDKVKTFIQANKDIAKIRTAMRSAGMKTLQQNALLRVIDGTTSVEELIRISQKSAK